MKKIMIFAAAAALLSLSSCGKEEIKNVTDASSNGSPVFTASINPGTKTTVNAQDGTLAWEETDVIRITDGGGNTAIYYISGIDGSTGKATFEYSSGDELGAGPYSASYGEQPEEAQTYSATAPGKLPMTASSPDNVLTFNVQCALMEINLTKAGEFVKKIEVTGTPTQTNEETTYTLTCTEPVSIAEKKAFYIALPAGTYTKIVITDSEDKVCTLNVKADGIPVQVNQIIPATFEAEHLDFFPAGALPGVFSVSDTKKVFFSQGNLYCKRTSSTSNDWKWHFYDKQYKYYSLSTGSDRQATANDTEIDLFTWGYNATYSVLPNSTQYVGGHALEGQKQLNHSTGGDDWGVAYCESNSIDVGTWRTLSYAEWKYLFNTRTMKNGKDRYTLNITYGGKMGLALYPDDYDKDPVTGTVTDLPDGVVFLPAAGFRDGSNVQMVGIYGRYWSSTADRNNSAYRVAINNNFVSPGQSISREQSCSVRLVTDAN